MLSGIFILLGCILSMGLIWYGWRNKNKFGDEDYSSTKWLTVLFAVVGGAVFLLGFLIAGIVWAWSHVRFV